MPCFFTAFHAPNARLVSPLPSLRQGPFTDSSLEKLDPSSALSNDVGGSRGQPVSLSLGSRERPRWAAGFSLRAKVTGG